VLWFTSDEHYGHVNIIKYCNRPFANVHEMNMEIIKRHNSVVTPDDLVIHAGDFTLSRNMHKYAQHLVGNHVFLRGSHDKWMGGNGHEIWTRCVEEQWVVVCHYAMRVWPKSHYGSWMLYGHSHGNLPPLGKQWDVGVDNNNFFPVSFEEITKIMASLPDNPNLVSRRKR
jgi:calcineurin-like phosphoesterase family protein